MKLNDFEKKITQYLLTDNFTQDANYNGLQVQGTAQIKKVGFAVSPTSSIIKQAVENQCDTLITHHGLYWKKQKSIATGILGQRLKQLIDAQINLLSYHLPLDCHSVVGNNAQIGKVLSLSQVAPIDTIAPSGILYTGTYHGLKSELFKHIEQLHPHSTHIYDFGPKRETLKILWCSGAGADFMESEPCDIFITGEISERHYNLAQELEVSLVQAGHWASEVWGVKALSQWVESQMDLSTVFLNEFNPI